MKKVLREIFSGANGKLSAKRVIGGFAMAVALGCTITLVVRDGSNGVVENLLMTIYITSVSLLGLPAITGAWGSSKIHLDKSTTEVHTEETTITSNDCNETTTETSSEIVITDTAQSCNMCDTCEYKLKNTRNRK